MSAEILSTLVVLIASSVPGELADLPPTCESRIYCQGDLLHDVQLANLYPDSKTFVDRKLKYSEEEVIEKYTTLRSQYNGQSPPVDEVMKFVQENFEEGNELEEWRPPDFNPRPSLLNKVTDPLYKEWVVDLNNLSLTLSRKVKEDVKNNPGLYSFIYLPNGFVIPSVRFSEIYYWDSHFIIRGLLLCDMVKTTRGIIENFFHLLRTENIVPNGSRKYYLQRSQPPLLTHMVHEYFKRTRDFDFLRKHIELLEKEFNFWMTNRRVIVSKNNGHYSLARYYAPSQGPRPESYREDYKTAASLTTNEKTQMYINLKSAAESGFDFSTRWFIKDGTNNGDLGSIDTLHIIPVDLNAFLEANARYLSMMFNALHKPAKAKYYKHQAFELLKGIEAVLWDEKQGIWLDYDLKNRKSRDYFYGSNFAPLWTGSYRQNKHKLSERVLSYLAKYNIDQFIGGVPTSLYNSSQQWDFPNGWPPLQAILIEGLENLQTPAAHKKALEYASKWLRSNYIGFTKFKKMFEKYDVTQQGLTGSGGEYEAQDGFGWTNNVILKLFDMYGREVRAQG